MSNENKHSHYKDKSEYDLKLASLEHPKGTPDHCVTLALLHEREVAREDRKMAQTERSLRTARVAVIVAVLGILVGAAGVVAHIWTHFHPSAVSDGSSHRQPKTPKMSPAPPIQP